MRGPIGSPAEPDQGAVLRDPAWLLDRLDTSRGAAVFTQSSRDELSAQPFLDSTWARRGRQTAVPLRELETGAPLAPLRGIIWHTAFCCSTLIASCLDWPGACLALKEPMAVVELAQARRHRAPAATDRLVRAVFGLYGRRFAPDEAVVIKPSNAANTLAPDAGEAAERHLMVFSSCKEFVMSVVGGGPISGGAEIRRAFVRALLVERLLSGQASAPWAPTDISAATDLQVAALLWHVQARELRAAADAFGPDRVRSLDCADFLARPAEMLERLDGFFRLGLGPERTATIAAGPKLGAYAKQPSAAFDAGRRQAQFREIEQALGPALPRLVEWSYRMCPDTPAGDPIGVSLSS